MMTAVEKVKVIETVAVAVVIVAVDVAKMNLYPVTSVGADVGFSLSVDYIYVSDDVVDVAVEVDVDVAFPLAWDQVCLTQECE